MSFSLSSQINDLHRRSLIGRPARGGLMTLGEVIYDVRKDLPVGFFQAALLYPALGSQGLASLLGKILEEVELHGDVLS